MGVEVREAVVVLDGVCVLVHGDLVSVGDRGGDIGGGGRAVGGDRGSGGGESAGGQSRGEESLQCDMKSQMTTFRSFIH